MGTYLDLVMMPSSQRYVCDPEMEKIYTGIGLAKKSVNSRGINFCLLRISVAHATSLPADWTYFS